MQGYMLATFLHYSEGRQQVSSYTVGSFGPLLRASLHLLSYTHWGILSPTLLMLWVLRLLGSEPRAKKGIRGMP
ncbi:hypothetical protein FRX31_027835 [Thalictrum thalictroides]|uniref:Uncharacterized protein n=1 Tax=Thalictrum thalictroides TaxID=46969 RepID=A0A7J6VBX0_THATH|nr:hypothetical protein FRX31_027835 [Thalictrum thalictroides]